MGVEELTRQICIGLFVWKVIDEVMGVYRNINAKNSSRGVGEFA